MKASFFLTGMLVIGLIAPVRAKAAETIVQQRARQANRLLPLKKITVGPDDQYAPAADPTGRVIVYTHKADLVAHLRVQDLKTGETKDLLPLNADSQEPVFSPDGRLAFTYFRFNARGDICYVDAPFKGELRTLEEKDIKCLKRTSETGSAQRLNPFWKSSGELGYLERDLRGNASHIVSESLANGERKVLMSGAVWSPSMKPGGHLLAFNELVGTGDQVARRLAVRDLATQDPPHVVQLALPGLSGFPVFAEDESQIYFSHFMNDTNNDLAIDGADNAVVFRIPVSRILASKPGVELFPEQLTSVENSCSFPRPNRDLVFVTCAFEGSLDVYQMPLTGVVPTTWDQKLLTNAMQSSRSYQDRILLLNTMKFRFPQSSRDTEERLLSDHIFSDDTQAARFYLKDLLKQANPADQRFFNVLATYLEARDLKKAQPTEEVSRELRRQILAIDERAARLPGEPRFRAAVRGLMRFFIDEFKGAESFVKETRVSGPMRPLERYFVFELASRVHRRGLPGSLPSLIEDYKAVMAAPELTEESQIYYAFSLLKELGEIDKNRAQRISQIEKLNGLPGPVLSLLKSEAATLKLIEAKDDAGKMQVYSVLDKLMIESRTDYFLRKALYVRAILNFADAAEFKFLNYIATNWLRYTELSDTEFAYAKAVFADANLDRAYETLGKKQYEFASNYFYEALSATDDLESHYGYIKTRTLMNERATIDQRYKVLQNRQFIGDNMKYVEALLILIDGEPKAAKDPKDVKTLDLAIEKLKTMEQDRDSATRYLLLGYCYLEKLMRLADGPDFRSDLFEESHRNLMLAYDLGRENDRIKASALTNLGLLHSRIQNFGLASRFLEIRKRIVFNSDEDRARFEYVYANALAHNHQPDRASDELASLPETAKSTPILERQAFDSAIADKSKEAAAIYERLLKGGQISGDDNLARVNLAYGYALFKLKRVPEAQAALRVALDHAGKLKREKAGGQRIVEFQPDRIKLVAYGLLGQIGSVDDRRDALNRRAELLQSSRKEIDDWLPLLIQNRLQAAELEAPVAAASRIGEAMKLTEEYGKANQYVANPVFRTIDNALALALSKQVTYEAGDLNRLKDLYAKAMKAFEEQKIAQPALDFQKLKMQMLWAAFTKRALGRAEGEVGPLLSSTPAQGLKTSLPAQYKELETLAGALEKI